jgi:ketosteroid isomerase-like protein
VIVVAEVDDFLAAALPPLRAAETAFHNGDAGPRAAMWSHQDPVTLFGARLGGTGWAEVGQTFEFVASRFSNCESCEWQVIAAGASGELGYIVAHELTTASVGGAPPETYQLRSTTIFRREDDVWKAVHRHADPMPGSESAPGLLARLVESDTPRLAFDTLTEHPP